MEGQQSLFKTDVSGQMQQRVMHNYSIGDTVIVSLPRGPQQGKVFAIYKNFAWTDETRYEVRGKELVTITSARNMSSA
jgi:hypothetical protein